MTTDRDTLLSMGFEPARVECMPLDSVLVRELTRAYGRGDQGNRWRGTAARDGSHPGE